jgi:hypothetical protein
MCLAVTSAQLFFATLMWDILCKILKFCRYAYSVLALNFTLAMGTSSTDVSRRYGSTIQASWTHRICCRKPGIGLLCWAVSTRSCRSPARCSTRSLPSPSMMTYPVPHCSTLVMFSWRRLFSHATSSCLWGTRDQQNVAGCAMLGGGIRRGGRTLIPPFWAVRPQTWVV